VAHRNYGRDIESGQARRLEAHIGQHVNPRIHDDHERRGRQRGQKRPDLGDAGGLIFGVEHTFLQQPQCRVEMLDLLTECLL
jgi:hypothetical protein